MVCLAMAPFSVVCLAIAPFSVICLAIAPFSSRPPPHTGGTRQVFDGWFASAFPSTIFLRVFPGFSARPFRGVGVGFEEPRLRLMV